MVERPSTVKVWRAVLMCKAKGKELSVMEDLQPEELEELVQELEEESEEEQQGGQGPRPPGRAGRVPGASAWRRPGWEQGTPSATWRRWWLFAGGDGERRRPRDRAGRDESARPKPGKQGETMTISTRSCFRVEV